MSDLSEVHEQRFRIEELFFTRTDERGIIQSGNQVFQRVSVYPWNKLVGAPHKVVRHKDMPKGVFYEMWKTIKDGDPMGAYVMNMAEDGVAYWVFATVLPIEGGYISLRLKPTCGILEKVIPIYESLRSRERAGELTPETSGAALLEGIQGLGYADYSEFMSSVLRDEVAARETALGRRGNLMRDTLARMFKNIRSLEAQAKQIERTFYKTHQIPYNMRLQAGRLEGSDGPISVISGNHRQMTQTLEENLSRFGSESSNGANAIRLTLFKTSVSQLLEELAKMMEGEKGVQEDTRQKELDVLSGLATIYREQAFSEVRELSERVRRFGQQCRDMHRMMAGLELTRIMCKIERSKFDVAHSGLDEIVNRLSSAQDELGDNFEKILNTVQDILSRSEDIQRLSNTAPRRAVA